MFIQKCPDVFPKHFDIFFKTSGGFDRTERRYAKFTDYTEHADYTPDYALNNHTKKVDTPSGTSTFFVHPMRIELISSEPESGILSIELRVLHEKTVQKYIKSFCLPNK